jgi:hypothetical protein
MCEHLVRVEDYIRAKGGKESWRGQPWTRNCREWVYFEVVLQPLEIRHKLHLDACVEVHDYFDIKAGAELGLFCNKCLDGVMGMHPDSPSSAGKPLIG